MIEALNLNAERPAYRILATAGFFGPDDTLYQEGATIYFDGKPCEEMEPLNEAARQKYVAYIEELEAHAKAVAEKLNRPYTGRPRGIDGALEIATAVQRSEMSVLGHRKETSSIETVKDDKTPQISLSNRGRGRPRKDAISVTVGG